MSPDNTPPNYTFTLKEGAITRFHVAMCALCHGTVTAMIDDRELFERDLLMAGWENRKGIWFCSECC